MYDDEFEEIETVRPDVTVDEKTLNGGLKISVDLKADEIVNSVVSQLRNEVTEYMRSAVATEVNKLLLAKSYYQKEGDVNELMRGIIKEVVREKFDTVYPDVVGNQLNKMVEEVKKVTLSDGDNYSNDRTVMGLKDTVVKKIDAILAAEIKPLVAEQAKQIQEQVQANFAQNFIKTMIPLGLTKN